MIKIGHRSITYAQRMAIIKMYESGCRICDISKKLGITRKTIYLWLKRYETEGSLASHTRKVYERSTTSEQDAEIIASHFANPFLSTQESSAKYNVSTETIRRRLKQAGLSKYRFGVGPDCKKRRSSNKSNTKSILVGTSQGNEVGDLATLGAEYASDHVKCDLLQSVPFPETANDFQTPAINNTEEDSKRCLQNVPRSSANIYNTMHDMDMKNFMAHKPLFDLGFGSDIKYCNDCKGEIVGFRYACVQCAGYDLCVTCEGRGAHAQHYALRVPAERPAEEVKTILEKIRKILEQEIPEEEVLYIKVEADNEGNRIIDDDCPESRVMVKIEVHESEDELTPPIDGDTTYDIHRNAEKDFEFDSKNRPNILKRPTHPARRKQSKPTHTSRRKKVTQPCEPDIHVQIGADLVKPKRSAKTISIHKSRATSSKSISEPSSTNIEPIMETNKDSRMLIPVYLHNTQELKPTDVKSFQIQPDPLIRVPRGISEALYEDPLFDPSLTADPLLIKTESHD